MTYANHLEHQGEGNHINDRLLMQASKFAPNNMEFANVVQQHSCNQDSVAFWHLKRESYLINDKDCV